MDLRPIKAAIGLLMIFMAIAMIFPALADAYTGNPDWQVFLFTSGIVLFVGLSLWMTGGGGNLGTREAFALVTLVWTIMPAVGAIPLLTSSLSLSLTDAYFEAVSGITTTGSTVLTGLDTLPPGILLWRGILQWLGGLGFIVMAVSLLPVLQIGGMQMFRVEAFETFGKSMPRVRQVSGQLTVVYLFLTGLLCLGLLAADMNGLDAIVHAMTTVATGGYSNYDDSVAHFDSALVDGILTMGMFASGIPFILYTRALRGDVRHLLVDEQVRLYTSIMGTAILLVALWLVLIDHYDVAEALRYSAFNITSIMTGTGYVSDDYGLWGGFPVMVVVALTFLGGCSGSTACGIKVFRVQILFKAVIAQVQRLVYPNGIFNVKFNGHSVDLKLIISVATVLLGFLALFVFLSAALSAVGLDLETAMSAAATAICNVGPGLGEIVGPTGNFQPLPDAAKWMLTVGMLLGRLELLTFLVLLSPMFWRK